MAERMRKLSFIITIILIFILTTLLILQKPISVNSKEEIANLLNNQKVVFQGKIIEEKFIGNSKLIKFNNGLEAFCEDCPYYKNKLVKIEGIMDEYNSKKEIKILKIIILENAN